MDSEGYFEFIKGYCRYEIVFNEPIDEEQDYDTDGAIDSFTVKSVTYDGLSYAVYDVIED